MSVAKRLAKTSSLVMKSLITPVAATGTFAAGYMNPYRTGQQKDPSVGGTAISYGVPLGVTAGAVAGHNVKRLVNNAITKGQGTIFSVPVQKLAPHAKTLSGVAAAATGATTFAAALAAAAKGARLRREDEWASLARDKDRVEGSVQASAPDLNLTGP